jgi:hypothetical protein
MRSVQNKIKYIRIILKWYNQLDKSKKKLKKIIKKSKDTSKNVTE